MEIKKGIGVSPGVVISTAVVLDSEDLLIPRRAVAPEQAPQELQRLTEAIAHATGDLTKLRDRISSEVGKEIGGILDFHLAILRDKSVLSQIQAEIKNQN